MAKKEISPINFKKYTDINEINMTSRLLGKMLDEHEKKIKENIVTQPIRVSQKIQSQEKIQTRENKISSVLSSVKQQVVIENTRIFNSTNRSPEEKELRISVNSNLPILMEKEKDNKKSPLIMSIKSDNSRGLSNNLQTSNRREKFTSSTSEFFTTIDTKKKFTGMSDSTPPRLRGEVNQNIHINKNSTIDKETNDLTPNRFRREVNQNIQINKNSMYEKYNDLTPPTFSGEINQNRRHFQNNSEIEKETHDFYHSLKNQMTLRNQCTDNLNSTDDNFVISTANPSNKLSDYVLRNNSDNTTKNDHIKFIDGEAIENSCANLKGGRVDLSQLRVNQASNLNFQEKQKELDRSFERMYEEPFIDNNIDHENINFRSKALLKEEIELISENSITKNPISKPIASNVNVIFKTMYKKNMLFQLNKLSKIQKYFIRYKNKKHTRLSIINELFKKVLRKNILRRLKSQLNFQLFIKKFKRINKNRLLIIYFTRLKQFISHEKQNFFHLNRIFKNCMMKKIIYRFNKISNVVHLFRSLDNKYKIIQQKGFSIWKIKALKERFLTKAYLIIRNWRIHRIRTLRKGCRLIKLVLRIIFFRKFINNCNFKKFYEHFLNILRNLLKKEFQNLKDRFYEWKDLSGLKREVFKLKSGRPIKSKIRNELSFRINNPFYCSKNNKMIIKFIHFFKLQRLIKKYVLRKRGLQLINTENRNKTNDNIKRKLCLRNLIKENYFKTREHEKYLIDKYFKLLSKNSRFILNDEKTPLIKYTNLPFFIKNKNMIIKPLTAYIKLKRYLKIIGQKNKTKWKKIQNWCIKYIQRIGFKTLKTKIPRGISLNKIRIFTEKKILNRYFLRFLEIVHKLRRINYISLIILVKKIQINFRKLQKRHKKHKILSKVLLMLYRNNFQNFHSRFIFWMKHLHYAKLSKAICLIIDLMSFNSQVKQKNVCRDKINEFAIQIKNISFRNFLDILKIVADEVQNIKKANSFLQTIYCKEIYKFIFSTKNHASKLHKFCKILVKLYNKYGKFTIGNRFRLWGNNILNTKIFQSNSNNLKSFLKSIQRKFLKRFNLSMRLTSGRNLKLLENIIRIWKFYSLQNSLLKWFNTIKYLKKYINLSKKLNQTIINQTQNYFWLKLDEKYSFIQKFRNFMDCLEQAKIRNDDIYYKEFLENMKNCKRVKKRKVPNNFSTSLNFIHFFSKIIKNDKRKSNMKSKLQSFQDIIDFKLKKKLFENLNEIYIRYKFKIIIRNLNFKQMTLSLSKIKDRIKLIDLLETTRSLITFPTKQFVFAKLLTRSFSLNKSSKIFLDYLNLGLEPNYLRSLIQNQEILSTQSTTTYNTTEKNLLLQSFGKRSSKLSYNSPVENLFVRNIYSYKWWEIKNKSNENLNENANRNIFNYIEGFSLKQIWNEIVNQKIDSISFNHNDRKFRVPLIKDETSNHQIQCRKAFTVSINSQNSFYIAPLHMRIYKIDNVSIFEFHGNNKAEFIDSITQTDSKSIEDSIFSKNKIESSSQIKILSNTKKKIDLKFDKIQFEITSLKKQNLISLGNNVEILNKRKQSINKIEIVSNISFNPKISSNPKLKKQTEFDFDIEEFTIYPDKELVRKLKRDSEQNLKAQLRKNWINSQSVRKELDFQILIYNIPGILREKDLITNVDIEKKKALRIHIKEVVKGEIIINIVEENSNQGTKESVLTNKEEIEKIQFNVRENLNHKTKNRASNPLNLDDYDKTLEEGIHNEGKVLSRFPRMSKSNHFEETDLKSILSKAEDDKSPGNLRINIIKKEKPKEQNYFDVLGKLGHRKSKQLLNNIFDDADKKKEKKTFDSKTENSKIRNKDRVIDKNQEKNNKITDNIPSKREVLLIDTNDDNNINDLKLENNNSNTSKNKLMDLNDFHNPSSKERKVIEFPSNQEYDLPLKSINKPKSKFDQNKTILSGQQLLSKTLSKTNSVDLNLRKEEEIDEFRFFNTYVSSKKDDTDKFIKN